ncbi:MAG TPA: hypothetical protein VJS37_15290 [Terriglobales bacterium]|nr:hypothetical protein [Terriglobales bacterium]
MPFREVDFLIGHIRVGLTWSRLASTCRDETRQERSRANARKAYDMVLAVLKRTALAQTEEAKINASLASLRSELQELGENL